MLSLKLFKKGGESPVTIVYDMLAMQYRHVKCTCLLLKVCFYVIFFSKWLKSYIFILGRSDPICTRKDMSHMQEIVVL